jgi:hypothetical protein
VGGICRYFKELTQHPQGGKLGVIK